jgi:CDGSH-type Zn-finger protein
MEEIEEFSKVIIISTGCGCGRSLSMPHCDGSHGLTEEQYKERVRQKKLAEYQKFAQAEWFRDGSYAGRKAE